MPERGYTRTSRTGGEAPVRYLVRINPRAWNPITQKVDTAHVWEVEQCKTKDSAKVKWHCAAVSVNGAPIREFFRIPKQGEPPWEFECYGICLRGQDDTIELHTGPKEASGN